MIPVVALIGRPNVGKSTVFNQLTGRRNALVADVAGLTRDRQYGEFSADDRQFIVIDSGGISGADRGVEEEAVRQTLLAVEEADLLVMIVDTREGLCPADRDIADRMRKLGKSVLLVANKVDGVDERLAGADFHELGLGAPLLVSAIHGRGIASLKSAIAEVSPEPETEDFPDSTATGIRIAIVGRPNVGKSTLVNRMLGEERVVVFDQPGTTRDSIYVNFSRAARSYTLIDTAGIRRRRSVSDALEKFSIIKSLQAIEDANVVIVMLDAREGLVDQDVHLIGTVIDRGKALVIACNKWDGLAVQQKDRVKNELDRKLRFIDYADIHFISALHGSNVGNLYASVTRAYDAANARHSSKQLTDVLEQAVVEHPPPAVRGRRVKLRYAHSGGHNPPIVVIHGNQTDQVPDSYRRYLEKVFRRELDLTGTPLIIRFQNSENPYAARKNRLTPRQLAKRKRLIRHVRGRKR